MTRSPGCAAYRVSDQMTCPRCTLTWDMNDPEPPECKRALTPRPRPIPFKYWGPNITLGTRRRVYPRK